MVIEEEKKQEIIIRKITIMKMMMDRWDRKNGL